MTSERVSLYIPDQLADVLDAREDKGESLSCRIAAIIDRYGLLVRHHRPQLTRAEWCLILDACNGWGLTPEPAELHVQGIALNVHDDDRLNGGGAKWGLTREQVDDLVRRLDAMNTAERIALVECIGRFWRRAPLPTTRAMREAGIEPTDGLGDE